MALRTRADCAPAEDYFGTCEGFVGGFAGENEDRERPRSVFLVSGSTARALSLSQLEPRRPADHRPDGLHTTTDHRPQTRRATRQRNEQDSRHGPQREDASGPFGEELGAHALALLHDCLLYTSDAADDM
eukprot:1234656-Rhodomonas_salina.1